MNLKKLKLWLYFWDLISKVYARQKNKYFKGKSKKSTVSLTEEWLMISHTSDKVQKKIKIKLKNIKVMMTSTGNKIIRVIKN